MTALDLDSSDNGNFFLLSEPDLAFVCFYLGLCYDGKWVSKLRILQFPDLAALLFC